MEKKIRQLLRYLQIEYVAVWVLPLLLVALYETGVMTEGAYAGDVRMDYVLQTVGILLAVGLIPLSLRLFSLSLVKNVKQRSLPEALTNPAAAVREFDQYDDEHFGIYRSQIGAGSHSAYVMRRD